MASIIDNRNKTMLDSLKNSLKQAESVDILTACFYFSGFNALAEELKDKKYEFWWVIQTPYIPGLLLWGVLCVAQKTRRFELQINYN